ncbi:hypothetical protein BGZ60DRAFT_527593 [Tricladium varicosporioides]|nr:hypothetical protein BGZ60DRAFT_527593 [Hymenoscyphus varicosporioides]
MHTTLDFQNRKETETLQTNVEDEVPFHFSQQQQFDRSQKLKTQIRILRFISRVGATALATATLCLEVKTISLYVHTHNIKHGGRGPWARQTSLWPSILLASVSSITVFIGILILGAYTQSIRTANKVNLAQTIVTVGVEVTHIIVWITVAVLYRKGRTGHDLWGWACSPLAEKIQPNFKDLVNFTRICQRGETNWVLSVVNPAFTVFNLSIWYFVWQRRNYKKSQDKIWQEELESKEFSPAP